MTWKTTTDKSFSMNVTWDVTAVIAEQHQVPLNISRNVVRLLDDDNTIPFIARYRKEQTNAMEPDKLRSILETLSEMRSVEKKIQSVHNSINKLGKMSKFLEKSLLSAQTMHEVEILYAPFKPGSQRSLAEQAREAGLEPAAENILYNGWMVNFATLVQPPPSKYSSIQEVKTGVKYIIADIIAKNTEARETINRLFQTHYVVLESKKKKTAEKKTNTGDKKAKAKPGKKNVELHKFFNYFDFKCGIRSIKPHQVLAINRGEENGILSVKIVVPDRIKYEYLNFCCRTWIRPATPPENKNILEDCFQDAFKRLVSPQMCRFTRSELTKTAEKASIEVFCSNLKSRLLMSPLRGKIVLAIDPGFLHGCKVAVISETGQVLYTDTLYLHNHKSNVVKESEKLVDIINSNRCEVVAIGNGTACRETESILSKYISQKSFGSQKVQYCIVDESGASIYSVSPVAQKELPDMDQNIRGAVSIARRLQDPIAELVKIEPKHIGVGMYQHDVADSKLKDALDGIVQECVSFVGVDLNTASEHLLRMVSGLNSSQAKHIIEWREKQGNFCNREQLRLVKGIGEKTYNQCAGFVRINPTSNRSNLSEEVFEVEEAGPSMRGKRKLKTESKQSSKKVKLEVNDGSNPLDRTWIHPESYGTACKFIKQVGASIDQVGFPPFIDKVKQFMNSTSVEKLAKQYEIGEPTMSLIVTGLTQAINYDIREESEKPLFRTSVMGWSDLKVGEQLSGRVSNVTHFGAFVDIGVGTDGLLHVSGINKSLLHAKNRTNLAIGDKIEVKVTNFDVTKKRIGLSLVSFL
ncbi:S1 RNA-binding domain-containing protein 1 isoform X2 [Octopus bimaculoides]|uniref:S1 RNA-binding domain-containing protein 1 isoform X2 n=1 Tax=Octopus bimaculoides TaxID=37653 RepID=UPI00071C830A|nr:S1 RNA-binding domain-containing protein 1 isoform X2 [Octopus bimaculoides]|eukprot:XP_014769764.1 PREDICTED: S1 RNA-binding domain-containing protein 1-like isoform X2 [Octopus bimaculoides]